MKRKKTNRRIDKIVLLASSATVGLSLSAYADNATWIGGTNSWAAASAWSGQVVPNNGSTTFNVYIDGDNAANSTVDLNFGIHITTISNLNLSAGDTLN